VTKLQSLRSNVQQQIDEYVFSNQTSLNEQSKQTCLRENLFKLAPCYFLSASNLSKDSYQFFNFDRLSRNILAP